MFNDTVTPQAIAGYRRSQRDREARHRKAWGMLAEVVALPPAPSFEERRARQRAAAVESLRRGRKEWADDWRKVRTRLRELDRARAIELLAEWNARNRERRPSPSSLLSFLNEREPTPRILASRREGRLSSARIHIEVSRRTFSWYIAHVGCPEGEVGAADLAPGGFRRVLRCIACLAEWRTTQDVATAEAAGHLVLVDCRLAEQLDLL